MVANPLPDISVNEDAADSTIDLSHVFNDIDDDNASINKTASRATIISHSIRSRRKHADLGLAKSIDHITVNGTSSLKRPVYFHRHHVRCDDAPQVAIPLRYYVNEDV